MTKQAPIGSGFTERSTATETLAGRDLRGITAIVTGGHAGIGLETTRALVGGGATVVIGARDVAAGARAVADLKQVEVAQLDLFAPASVDAFAARFMASERPLHLLINNAGIMAVPLARDARGYESQLATNHLGHFQLTARLWPALVRAGGARVVALSSRGHSRSAFDFEDPQFVRRDYDKWIAYGQAKTANALFALALDARGTGHGVRAFSVHPGAVNTNLSASVPKAELDAIRARLAGSHYKTTPQGAATSVWCATSAQLAGMGGVYCEDGDIAAAVPADATSLAGARPWICDPTAADRLWTLTEELTGVTLAAAK